MECELLIKVLKQSEIKISPVFYKQLFINLDQDHFELIKIKLNEKTLTFPLWEFWQVLDRYESGPNK